MASHPDSRTASPRLIRAKDAARQLGVPYSSLRDAAFRGELPVVRIGGDKDGRHAAWYLERGDVDRWIETRKSA